MHGIDINNTVFITAVTAVNEERLKLDPPQSIVCDDPVAVAAGYKLDNETIRRARRYDHYNDIKVMSMRTGGKCYHMVSAEALPQMARTGSGFKMPDNAVFYANELAILRELWERNCLLNTAVAGWKLDDFLPLLVYKGIWYRLNVDDRFKMDPASSAYPVIPGLLRVETIYQQSVRDNRRPLPAITDLYSWWNIPLPWNAPSLTRDDLSKLTPENWCQYGFRAIENMLFAQEYLVRTYYGYK